MYSDIAGNRECRRARGMPIKYDVNVYVCVCICIVERRLGFN